MSVPFRIDRDTAYSLQSATAGLDVRRETLLREIRLGRLEARKRAGRYWILGSWLIRWLETGKPHAAWDAAHGAKPVPEENGRRGAKRP
jgi:hypothetical protein